MKVNIHMRHFYLQVNNSLFCFLYVKLKLNLIVALHVKKYMCAISFMICSRLILLRLLHLIG